MLSVFTEYIKKYRTFKILHSFSMFVSKAHSLLFYNKRYSFRIHTLKSFLNPLKVMSYNGKIYRIIISYLNYKNFETKQKIH